MATFFEMRDGTVINLEHVLRFWPPVRSNRIDLVDGTHYLMSNEDAAQLKAHLFPKPKVEAETKAPARGRKTQKKDQNN